MMDDLERQLLAAERPEPGANLRERVLAAMMPLVRADASRLDRIWFSRSWRMAAAAVLVGLLGAETQVRGVLDASRPAAAPAADSLQVAERIAREVGLGPRDAETFARRMLAQAGRQDGREKADIQRLLAGESR